MMMASETENFDQSTIALKPQIPLEVLSSKALSAIGDRIMNLTGKNSTRYSRWKDI